MWRPLAFLWVAFELLGAPGMSKAIFSDSSKIGHPIPSKCVYSHAPAQRIQPPGTCQRGWLPVDWLWGAFGLNVALTCLPLGCPWTPWGPWDVQSDFLRFVENWTPNSEQMCPICTRLFIESTLPELASGACFGVRGLALVCLWLECGAHLPPFGLPLDPLGPLGCQNDFLRFVENWTPNSEQMCLFARACA